MLSDLHLKPLMIFLTLNYKENQDKLINLLNPKSERKSRQIKNPNFNNQKT
ncbi:hypothetical protein HanIR_Chr01g0042001 [Helianthus annuus]|nr:hypothetical protein HanIR_Chr01g0042001 [Helianthus annuus]